MIRVLILLHRWLGIASCLLFAMWFSTGIVMHFIAFPALTEAERFAGLAPIEPHQVGRAPVEAVEASGIPAATRVRLLQRIDGPVYLVSDTAGTKALRAADVTDAAVRSDLLALAIAVDHARRRGIDASDATLVGLAPYDQWSVPDAFDRHRPLYRIALNDEARTELYVSSVTGEVVLDTTRHERWLSYAGSVAHWIYPTVLRRRPAAWHAVVWWVSLVALLAAISGAWLGTTRIKLKGYRLLSPYQGLQAWHHVLGLISMAFILSWIFSGWLSMDDGRLFSRDRVTSVDAKAFAGVPAWGRLPPDEMHAVGPQTEEVEWFAFDGKIYRRERIGLRTQRLVFAAGDLDGSTSAREFLAPGVLRQAASHLAQGCTSPVIVDANDDYAVAAIMPDAPVYRSVCGDVWYDVDGASGALIRKLDPSSRAYRWLYSALHTFDFPALTSRPMSRTGLIVTLCGLGLAFSLTGVVIGWRRLRW